MAIVSRATIGASKPSTGNWRISCAIQGETGSPIRIELDDSASDARVHIHNDGPAIPPELIDAIFEYGVSDAAEDVASGQRGQGLFVAKTYMAKMGGTIVAENSATNTGVRCTLSLPKALPS